MNKKDIDPANVQILRMMEGDVDAIAVIDSMYFGAPQPEYYRKKLGSAAKGAGTSTSWVPEVRATILQAECKR